MVSILKISRAQSNRIDNLQQAVYDKKHPAPAYKDPAYRDLQNITDIAKRGERL